MSKTIGDGNPTIRVHWKCICTASRLRLGMRFYEGSHLSISIKRQTDKNSWIDAIKRSGGGRTKQSVN